MLEKLTKKQEKLISVVRDEYLDRFFSCENICLNEGEVRKYVEWLYIFSGLKEPQVIIFESPLGLQIAANIVADIRADIRADIQADIRDNIGANIGVNIRDNIGANIRADIRANIRADIQDNIGANIGANIRDNIGANIGANIRANIGDNIQDNIQANIVADIRADIRANIRADIQADIQDNIGANIGANIRANIGANIQVNIRDNIVANIQVNKLKFYPFSYYGNITDYGWVAFYDYFTRIGILDNKNFNQFMKIIKLNIYEMIQFEGLCLVCKYPNKIQRNQNNRLHCETASAISWQDGYELYYWNGVEVGEKLIKHSEKLTKEDILNEKNVEKRRCIQEKLGSEKFASLLNIEEIDSDIDNNGYKQILYKTKDRDNLINDYLYFVRVGCPTTKREYFLSVPESKNIWESIAWTFGKKKKEYKPILET